MKDIIIEKSKNDKGIFFITGNNSDYYPEINGDSTTAELLTSISTAIPGELIKDVQGLDIPTIFLSAEDLKKIRSKNEEMDIEDFDLNSDEFKISNDDKPAS